MGSINSRTGVVELRDSSSGGDNRGHSEANIGSNESGARGGAWAILPNSDRRTASAPTKTRSSTSRQRTRPKTSTEDDLHMSKLSQTHLNVPVHNSKTEGHGGASRQCFPLLRDCKVHPDLLSEEEDLEYSKSLVEVNASAKPEMKAELKRYKKYVLEDHDRIAAAKLLTVEKQMAEMECANLRLQDEVQLLEEKIDFLQDNGPIREQQPDNYAETLKLKDQYIQKLGKETRAIRAEVTQLKSKYKKKLREKTEHISEMRQLHCIQVMEIRTEMEKLVEENDNLTEQLSRSDRGHVKDVAGGISKMDDKRTNVIVELSEKVSEQESRIIDLENKLCQRDKHISEAERPKSSRHRPAVEDIGDTRRGRDSAVRMVHGNRHCHSDGLNGDWEKRPATQKHVSDTKLGNARPPVWDDPPHDTVSLAKTHKSSPDVAHKTHAYNYESSRHAHSNTLCSVSSASDLYEDEEDDCWDDEDFSTGDKKCGKFHMSVNSAFGDVVGDATGHGRHHVHNGHPSKSTTKSTAESPKQQHRHKERTSHANHNGDTIEHASDDRHASKSHTDTVHRNQ